MTRRQRDVVALVAVGLTRRQIAERLQVRETTVRFHLKAIARTLPGSGHELRRIRLHARELLDATPGPHRRQPNTFPVKLSPLGS